jgi:transposase InsO family protein
MYASVNYVNVQSRHRIQGWDYIRRRQRLTRYRGFSLNSLDPWCVPKEEIKLFLAVLDSFSKFVAFYPAHNITSAVVCDILESRYFTAYGVPKSIVSDNAKVFRLKAFYDICFRWGIKKINSIPYYHPGKGLTAT